MAKIEKRGENSWRLTVSAGIGPDGKYIRKRKTVKVTEKMSPKQLEKHLMAEFLKFEKQVKDGLYIEPSGLTFRQVAEKWQEHFLPSLAETAQLTHKAHLQAHILPALGHLRMDRINALHLTDFLASVKRKDKKEGELSVWTKQDIYKTLKNVFKFAREKGIIQADPMEGVSKPSERRKKKAKQVYELEQIGDLMEKLKGEPLQWQLFVNLAIWCGLRRSELLGLEWRHIDMETRLLTVERALVHGLEGVTNKETKSETSERVVEIPSSLLPLVKQYRERWNRTNMEFRDLRVDLSREYVFCNEAGEPVKPNSASQWWRRFTERKEVPFIRLHDLRHTHASLLLAEGVAVTDVAASLGHASPQVTLAVYSHCFETATARTAAKMDSVIGSLSPSDVGANGAKLGKK